MYDVADRVRLRRAHDVMLGFGDPLQYSVFDCRLSEKELVLLVEALTEVISATQDRVLLAKMGPDSPKVSSRLKFLGVHGSDPVRKPLVL